MAVAAQDRTRAIEVMTGLLVQQGMDDRDLAAKTATALVDEAISARDKGTLVSRFDPAQVRDRHGRWARNPGAALTGGTGGGHLPAGPIAVPAGADSMSRWMRPDGTWDPQRAALHRTIVDQTLAGLTPHDSPQALFLGGGPASGKSVVLASQVTDMAHIDADAIKAKLPEYREKVAAGDKSAAAYVHEESSAVAKMIQAEAAARRLNFMLDGTGDSDYAKMEAKIANARQGGHSIHLKYVTVDTPEAVRRANARAAKTGRFVPEAVIRSVHASVSDVFSKLIAGGVPDSAELWDTNGPQPLLVGSKPEGGQWAVHNPAAWQRFLAKRGG